MKVIKECDTQGADRAAWKRKLCSIFQHNSIGCNFFNVIEVENISSAASIKTTETLEHFIQFGGCHSDDQLAIVFHSKPLVIVVGFAIHDAVNRNILVRSVDFQHNTLLGMGEDALHSLIHRSEKKLLRVGLEQIMGGIHAISCCV